MTLSHDQINATEYEENQKQESETQLNNIAEYVYVEDNNIFIEEEIINDSSLNINQEDLSYFKEYYSDINEMADNGEITIDEETLEIVEEGTVITASSGTTVNYYWWGVEIYLNQSSALDLAQSWQTAGSGAAGLSALSRFIPTPPTAIASAITAALGGATVHYANRIESNTTENGVRLEIRLPAGLYAYPR